MGNSNSVFRPRAFVATVLVFSGVSLPVTGIANHFWGFAPLSIDRHAWMSAHNAAGILFVVFSIWHIVLNRKGLRGHLRNTAAQVSTLSRETVLAASVVAITLAFFVGHAFHAGH